MRNNYIQSLLDDNKKNLLSYELSKEHIFYVLNDYQNKFNEIYRIFINIFRKIFYMKKPNKSIEEELKKFIDDLQKMEQLVLNKYKLLSIYNLIAKSDINNTDIYLEFTSQEEQKEFFENLNKRKNLLETYQKQFRELFEIKNRINSIYEKITSMSSIDISK